MSISMVAMEPYGEFEWENSGIVGQTEFAIKKPSDLFARILCIDRIVSRNPRETEDTEG